MRTCSRYRRFGTYLRGRCSKGRDRARSPRSRRRWTRRLLGRDGLMASEQRSAKVGPNAFDKPRKAVEVGTWRAETRVEVALAVDLELDCMNSLARSPVAGNHMPARERKIRSCCESSTARRTQRTLGHPRCRRATVAIADDNRRTSWRRRHGMAVDQDGRA